MPEIFRNPFFYIVLGCVLVFLYAIFVGRKKKKKGKGKKDDKKADDTKGGNASEDVKPYEDFKNEEKPHVDAIPTGDENLALFDEIEVKPFEEQANEFFDDEENQRLFDEFFGSGEFNPFGNSAVGEQPIDYTIKEYNYNKVWETEPEAISFDYDNYDVNYTPPKKQTRIKKQLKKMNKTQKALLFANILERKTFTKLRSSGE